MTQDGELDKLIRQPIRGLRRGRAWFTVLYGTVVLLLGAQTLWVEAGQAAEFSTMAPPAFGAHDGPAEVLCILNRHGGASHLDPPCPPVPMQPDHGSGTDSPSG